ncbi:MAG: 2OG-Fe(II) oxygenase [Proteobacteria bacterium]|nr:2OG-Fe(II) oxygenase [Pseudomonadota bacterium]
MSNNNSFINLEALKSAKVNPLPFPYVIIPQFIKPEYLDSLVQNFPPINDRGSIPGSSLNCSPLFRKFVEELEGSELQKIISEKFDLALENKPTMLTLRGYTTERDGKIHTDSKSKLITLLLYMNPAWETNEGKLRLLYNKDSLEDYAAEISPLAGNCLIFRVTENGWHGHYPFVGKRLSLQLNYLANDTALVKHLNHHRLTAFFKRTWAKVLGKNLPVEENY